MGTTLIIGNIGCFNSTSLTKRLNSTSLGHRKLKFYPELISQNPVIFFLIARTKCNIIYSIYIVLKITNNCIISLSLFFFFKKKGKLVNYHFSQNHWAFKNLPTGDSNSAILLSYLAKKKSQQMKKMARRVRMKSAKALWKFKMQAAITIAR